VPCKSDPREQVETRAWANPIPNGTKTSCNAKVFPLGSEGCTFGRQVCWKYSISLSIPHISSAILDILTPSSFLVSSYTSAQPHSVPRE
jgi:hypothetical protein